MHYLRAERGEVRRDSILAQEAMRPRVGVRRKGTRIKTAIAPKNRIVQLKTE